ncbi:MAG TPA: hypothetical protein VK811_05340 [Candidatus Acidoferrum sp.]|nr:hypothetical protein [Candidatus Acidoferrum sp.]
MKKISGISILVSAIVLAGLVGCASNSGNSSQPAAPTAQAAPPPQPAPPPPPPKPKKKKGPIESRLVIGMGMDDVRAACGNPRQTAMNSDGSGYWTYASGSPGYTPWGGWSAKVHYVTVVFDTTGKVKSWSTADTDNGPPPPPF